MSLRSGYLSPDVKKLVPLRVKKYFWFLSFVSFPILPANPPECFRFAKSEFHESSIVKKCCFIIPYHSYFAWFLLLWSVCESLVMGIDFAYWNKGVDFIWGFYIHTQHLGALPSLIFHKFLRWFSACLSHPPPPFDFFLPSPAHYEIHWLLWKRWCCVWVELPREFWGSREKPRCLEWNGWLARMFRRCGMCQHNAEWYLVSNAALLIVFRKQAASFRIDYYVCVMCSLGSHGLLIVSENKQQQKTPQMTELYFVGKFVLGGEARSFLYRHDIPTCTFASRVWQSRCPTLGVSCTGTAYGSRESWDGSIEIHAFGRCWWVFTWCD